MAKCNLPCLVYSRVVGFYTETEKWNPGKQAEFVDRKTFVIDQDKLKKEEEKENER